MFWKLFCTGKYRRMKWWCGSRSESLNPSTYTLGFFCPFRTLQICGIHKVPWVSARPGIPTLRKSKSKQAKIIFQSCGNIHMWNWFFNNLPNQFISGDIYINGVNRTISLIIWKLSISMETQNNNHCFCDLTLDLFIDSLVNLTNQWL